MSDFLFPVKIQMYFYRWFHLVFSVFLITFGSSTWLLSGHRISFPHSLVPLQRKELTPVSPVLPSSILSSKWTHWKDVKREMSVEIRGKGREYFCYRGKACFPGHPQWPISSALSIEHQGFPHTNGQELEQTLGNTGGQRSLECYSPGGHKELVTT